MKLLKYIFFGSFLFLASCEEVNLEDSFIQLQQKLAEYYLDAEAGLSNTYTIVDLAIRDDMVSAGDTAEIYGGMAYKVGNTVYIDFGNGTAGPDAVIRKGTIEAVETGNYTMPGGSLNVTFDGYQSDDIAVMGQIGILNLGGDSFDVDATGFSVHEDFSITSNKTVSWTNGFDTDDPNDDLIDITGQTTGSDNSNNTVIGTISNAPLELDRSCDFLVLSGLVDLTFDLDSAETTPSGLLDFIEEDGCENLVRITLVDGDQETEVILQFDGF